MWYLHVWLLKYYVLPDNVSDVNCSSQTCATLDQYLLGNGSLPVLSDVEYHFLPGDHHVTNAMVLWKANYFSLIGVGLLTVKLICQPLAYIAVFYSYNVTIKNLMFSQCKNNFVPQSAASLFLYEYLFCTVQDVTFLDHGFLGVNLFGKSYLNNITINMHMLMPNLDMCSPFDISGSRALLW